MRIMPLEFDLDLATTFGQEHPEIYGVFNNLKQDTLLAVAKLAVEYTNGYFSEYTRRPEGNFTIRDSANCADRASLIQSLLSPFPDFYIVTARYENTEIDRRHKFNAGEDIRTGDKVIIDNSYRRRNDGTREGALEVITGAWTGLPSNRDVYGPIYKATFASMDTLEQDELLTHVTTEMSQYSAPLSVSGEADFRFVDRHIPQRIAPDEEEALKLGYHIYNPTILTVYSNEESCNLADQRAGYAGQPQQAA